MRKFEEASGGKIKWSDYRSVAEMDRFHSMAREISKLTYQEKLFDAGNPNDQGFLEETWALANADAGHDAQLHLHPVWRKFRDADWAHRLADDLPSDTLCGRSPEAVKQVVEEGATIFERWGLPRPIALRMGSLQVDAGVFDGIERAGIRLSSSIAVGIYAPPDGLGHYGGVVRVGEVVEVPVLSYRVRLLFGFSRLGCLTVTRTREAATRSLLWAARQHDVSPIVILTHPFEFVMRRSHRFTGFRPDRVNQGRLLSLCQFLSEHSDRVPGRHFHAGRGGLAVCCLCSKGRGFPKRNRVSGERCSGADHRRASD